VAFVSFDGGIPQVRIMDLDSKQQRPLVPGGAMTFAPRYSPDGSKILFSMMLGANSDIYVVGADGGIPQRLTTSPAIDTDASFSPDGSKIVFESDRSGTQQLYVMNADGTNQRRITFSIAAYSSPEWSPDGNLIAYTWRSGDARRVGVIGPDGTGEKLLTGGTTDEEPSWAASSRELVFQRTEGNGRPAIYRVSLDGSAPRKMTIPQDGSDPDWSGTMD
jgi:TolB protein